MNQENERKPRGRYLFSAWILFLFIFAGYYGLPDLEQPLIANAYFKVPADFRSRLRKHGLDKQFSVVEMKGDKLYFYRDGKRCVF
jgi:hypothetical protein